MFGSYRRDGTLYAKKEWGDGVNARTQALPVGEILLLNVSSMESQVVNHVTEQ